MRFRWSIPALGAFFVALALVITGCGASVPGNSVASVGGNPITIKTLNHWLYVDAKGNAAQQGSTQPVIVPNDPPNFPHCIAQVRAEFSQFKKTSAKTLKADCQQLFTQLDSQILGYLIQGYWFQAYAHKQGISVSAATVQAQLDKEKKARFPTNGASGYAAYLKQAGETNADLLYQTRNTLIVQKLVKKQTAPVTQSDIAAYYTAHKSQFGTPERRNMRIVLAKTAAKASAARRALNSGHGWKTVAKAYSQDPTTKNKGGLLTNVSAGQQDAALSKAAFAAAPNKLIGPVKGQFGYYVLEVLKVTPGTQRSLAQSQKTIRQTLITQRQTAAQTKITAAAKAAYLSKTHCQKAYAMADCAGYKAPKTSTSAAAPTTSQTSTAPATSSSSSSATTSSSP